MDLANGRWVHHWTADLDEHWDGNDFVDAAAADRTDPTVTAAGGEGAS